MNASVSLEMRSRLSRLCKEGQPYLALNLFDTLPNPTTLLWNTLIIGFISNNMPEEALSIYFHLRNSSPNTKPDPCTFSSVLKACALTHNLDAGKALHCHILRSLSNSSMIVDNSLLSMYSSCDHVKKNDNVRKLFNNMSVRNVVAWNTLVAWYVKIERYEEAVRQFRMMMRMRVTPSSISFVNVFPAVSAIGDYRNADVFYGLVVKLGGERLNDLFLVSSAIFMYSELGCLGVARKIFDHCLERDTKIWNAMIGAYVQNNLPDNAIILFLQAVGSEESVIDEVTFLSALTACSQLRQLEPARQLHNFVSKHFTVMPVILQNAIIVMYSRCDSIETSINFFLNMGERDAVSWNTMISAFSQSGLNNEALMLVYEMQEQNFSVDYVTATTLLSIASGLENLEVGLQTHAYLIRHGIEFEGMRSYLIDMYAKCGSVRIAEWLFQKEYSSGRDQLTWNSMISGYTQNGLVAEAFAVFRQMLEQKVMPNVVTLASVLHACNLVGNVGKQLHGFSFRNYLEKNIFLRTALIDMYSKCGALAYAENVFHETPEKNLFTYTTMILGYGQHGMGRKAVLLFYSMKRYGIVPDAVIFVAVLSACSHAGLVDEGLSLYDSMKMKYDIKPTSAHFCCIADMLSRVGRVFEAYEFVKGLGEEGDVMEIWRSILGACRIHKQYELGKIVADKLLEMKAADSETHTFYSQICMPKKESGRLLTK